MTETEWKLLDVKRLTCGDLREKLVLPLNERPIFLDSIPIHDKNHYLQEKIIPITFLTHQSGDRYNESEEEIKIIASEENLRLGRCSFELPPLQVGFHYDTVAKVEYCWRDRKLHMRATRAYPTYADIDQMPTGWRFLGRKSVTKTDVRDRMLRLHQDDMTEFYNSIPTEELKEGLKEFVGFQVGIWMKELRCVSGHLKAADSAVMDVTNLGIEVSCKEAFKENKAFFRANTDVEVHYQWAYGTPFVAIVPNSSFLPLQTGEYFSLF